ncbi:hypothetical protein GCM10023185_17760 [Hymenobacter saemangeumensis]|uniref:Transporter n=1 Tax=Hymenobacter saemangeumensis TaxID=1084522 RepID=A0ABP8IB53_9BACT
MKLLTTLLAGLLLGSTLSATAQFAKTDEHDPSYGTHKHITVAVSRYAEAHAELSRFIRTRAARQHKQEETPTQLIANFGLPLRELPKLDSLVATLGFVLENNLNAEDLTTREQELRLEEKRQADPSGSERLFRVRQQLADLSSHAGQAYVTLRLYDEVSFPTGNRPNRVSFVNMPGVEYGFLRLDNPRLGLTSQAYQGYAIKYMFTRGKSYLNLGVYKPLTQSDADGFVNELFIVNLGQDFYPRNFGRGRRRFLNLYSCYQVGGFIMNRQGTEKNEFIPNLNLGLGVELLKTRHVLLDTKASYFIPLHDRSRDLRGIIGQASFNFVF